MSKQLRLIQYPFSVRARQLSQKLAPDIHSLIATLEIDENEYIIEAAEERILAALDHSEIRTVNTNQDSDVLVYPLARLIVEKINHPRLKEYQAEAESKAVNKHLSKESDEFVLNLCNTAFEWERESTGNVSQRAKLPLQIRSAEFRIRYENFLEVSPEFHSESWKFINRYVDSGWVSIRKSELHRLISGKFKQLIILSSIKVPDLSGRFTEAVQRIESELRVKVHKSEPIKITENIVTAFPPCIAQMHEDAIQGKNLSHEARFALAAFLLKIGI